METMIVVALLLVWLVVTFVMTIAAWSGLRQSERHPATPRATGTGAGRSGQHKGLPLQISR